MSENTVSVRRIGSSENEILDLDSAITNVVKENNL